MQCPIRGYCMCVCGTNMCIRRQNGKTVDTIITGGFRDTFTVTGVWLEINRNKPVC